jgi:hypothetical protein
MILTFVWSIANCIPEQIVYIDFLQVVARPHQLWNVE